MPALDLTMLERAAPGLTIALIGFMESISVAKTLARQYRTDIPPGQELTALEESSITSSLFGGYIVGGALSRSAVNPQAGAKTPLATIVTAAAIGLILVFLTPLQSVSLEASTVPRGLTHAAARCRSGWAQPLDGAPAPAGLVVAVWCDPGAGGG
jgi:hypothetical protein